MTLNRRLARIETQAADIRKGGPCPECGDGPSVRRKYKVMTTGSPEADPNAPTHCGTCGRQFRFTVRLNPGE